MPRTFWDTTAMQDALETRHMGRVILAYRNHPWHPRKLSQQLVGNWLGLTQVQVGRIENGRAPEELTKLIAWARILRIPPELLWFRLPNNPDGWDAAPDQAVPTVTVPVVLGGQTVLLPVDVAAARAQGLDGFLSHVGDADTTIQSLEGLPFSLPTPPQRNHLVQALGPADVAELERLAAAFDDARRYLDGSVVELFRAQLDRSKADDGTHGPAKSLPLTLGLLGAISQHVREVKPDVRQSLLTFGAEAAEFAGWLYRDLKDTDAAVYWYDRAMEWAQAGGDTPMQGYVLLKKSQMAYDERDAYQVATLAEAANKDLWQLPLRVRAEVTQQEARGLAMLGEPLLVVERKLDEAETLFTTQDAGNRPQFGSYFTESALITRRACCYVEAGKPANAAELFGSVLAGGSLPRRDEGFFRALRSYACALSGEPDLAAEEVLSALDVATETNSERTTRELGRTVKALTPWSSRPGPRRLREALTGAR